MTGKIATRREQISQLINDILELAHVKSGAPLGEVFELDIVAESADSGTDPAKKIREKNKTIPIYMLSSMGDGLSMNVDPNDYGLAGILQKPFNPELLLSFLKTNLD